MTMAMSGSYRIVSEGHIENVIIVFEMDDDCEVEYEIISTELVPPQETAAMREGNVPPHTCLYRLFSDGPVSGEVLVGTFPGIDMRAFDTSRFNELFASMVNYWDNCALYVFFENGEIDEFINDYCPY
jgi:hypothetical protein